MGLLDDCQALFGTRGLYEVLGVGREAPEADLRRGYYRNSLRVHPDRAPGDPRATAKFQTLGKAYAVLADARQRALYDRQGTVEDSADPSTGDGGGDWSRYWRAMFPQVTVRDIADFERTYVGSAEERADLLRLYAECRGDMDGIAAGALCGSHEDEPRVRAVLQEAVDRGELPALRAFTHESGGKKAWRRRRAEREAEECERMRREMGLGEEEGEDEGKDLTALIRSNAASREAAFSSLISSLEEKYCDKKPAATAKKKRPKKDQIKNTFGGKD